MTILFIYQLIKSGPYSTFRIQLWWSIPHQEQDQRMLLQVAANSGALELTWNGTQLLCENKWAAKLLQIGCTTDTRKARFTEAGTSSSKALELDKAEKCSWGAPEQPQPQASGTSPGMGTGWGQVGTRAHGWAWLTGPRGWAVGSWRPALLWHHWGRGWGPWGLTWGPGLWAGWGEAMAGGRQGLSGLAVPFVQTQHASPSQTPT